MVERTKVSVLVLRGMINGQIRMLQPEQYPLQVTGTERELVVQAKNDLVCHPIFYQDGVIERTESKGYTQIEKVVDNQIWYPNILDMAEALPLPKAGTFQLIETPGPDAGNGGSKYFVNGTAGAVTPAGAPAGNPHEGSSDDRGTSGTTCREIDARDIGCTASRRSQDRQGGTRQRLAIVYQAYEKALLQHKVRQKEEGAAKGYGRRPAR